MHVIDDESLINELICSVGELEGYEVRSFTKAEDFLALGDEELPDLLLVDIFMPDVDGFDLLNRLEKRKVIPKVVLMSGKDVTFLGAAGMVYADSKVRIVGELSKPCGVAEIRDVINMDRVFSALPDQHLTYTI